MDFLLGVTCESHLYKIKITPTFLTVTSTVMVGPTSSVSVGCMFSLLLQVYSGHSVLVHPHSAYASIRMTQPHDNTLPV